MAKVLIVDDNEEILEVLSTLLTIKQHDVSKAFSGKELMEFLNCTLPDIVILDVMLNKEDGREICKKIKTINNNIGVILFSASPKVLNDYAECGADDIIEKPFQIQNILDKINNILIRKKLVT